MFASSFTCIAVVASMLVSSSLGAAVPSVIAARDDGASIPASNPPGTVCYNSWESKTNDVSDLRFGSTSFAPIANAFAISRWCSIGT